MADLAVLFWNRPLEIHRLTCCPTQFGTDVPLALNIMPGTTGANFVFCNSKDCIATCNHDLEFISRYNVISFMLFNAMVCRNSIFLEQCTHATCPPRVSAFAGCDIISGNHTSFIHFVSKNPFSANDSLPIWPWNKFPYLISFKLGQLFLHCTNPRWI